MKLPSWLIEQKLVKKYKSVGGLLAAIGVDAEELTKSAVKGHWTTYEPEGVVDGFKIKVIFHARRFPGDVVKIENPRIEALEGTKDEASTELRTGREGRGSIDSDASEQQNPGSDSPGV